MTEMDNENEQKTDLLESVDDPIQHIEYATTGQRFLNWLIDNVIMRFTLSYVTGYAVGYMLAIVFPSFMTSVVNEPNRATLIVLGLIITIFNYIIYYTLCEKLFHGQTLGKLITGTRAVRTDGGDLTMRNAFLRTLCRLVPFEPFSAFGTPWHDSWTGTMVIKSRK